MFFVDNQLIFQNIVKILMRMIIRGINIFRGDYLIAPEVKLYNHLTICILLIQNGAASPGIQV
jgi:hypothetical protein